VIVEEGASSHNVNGILGALCKEHYPGLVWKGEDPLSATSFDHYALVDDVEDTSHRKFRNLADQVIRELWVSLLVVHFSIHRIHLTFLK
jgi:hypothetical protein